MNLAPVSKAVAGALTTLVVAWLVKQGVVLSPEVNDAIGVLIFSLTAAAIGWLGVYLAPKNKG